MTTTAMAVKERPINLSARDVRAILAGHKTQLRRIIKPQPRLFKLAGGGARWGGKLPDGSLQDIENDGLRRFVATCPLGDVGRRLWVKEPLRWADRLVYDADRVPIPLELIPDDATPVSRLVIPPSYMPRWAARITLEITAIRVERLQQIDELDALAEGIEGERIVHGTMRTSDGREVTGDWIDGSARDGFRNAWDQTYAGRGFPWSSNCWVWVVSFQRLES